MKTGLSWYAAKKQACPFKAHGSAKGRSSWDPMTALLAIAQDPETAGYSLVRGRAYVDPVSGENSFSEDPAGPHSYVKRDFPPEYYAEMINDLIRTTHAESRSAL